MSKIGNATIAVPAGVKVDVVGADVRVEGPKGEWSVSFPKGLSIEQDGDVVCVKRTNDQKKLKAMHGLYRCLVANAVQGVNVLWQKRLEIVGTGYNVKMQGSDLVFKVGYSHPVVFKATEGVVFQTEGNTKIIISGVDKQYVGEVASKIKSIKKPDPYKGKGIRYEGEVVRLKPGKKAKA